MALIDDIRRYWDDDAATYDDSVQHRPRSPAVQAAWTAALADTLPVAPARILDCGAGTGFLSLIAARLGHRVTALDLSAAMLERLQAKTRAEGLSVEIRVAAATEPPGEFDVVMERHLLWTLPDPSAALRAWRAAVPAGRPVLVESVWGDVDPVERARAWARRAIRQLRQTPPDHHAEYDTTVRLDLPLGHGTPPGDLIGMVTQAGWVAPRLRRLRDVEWAERQALPLPERLVGVTPRFMVTAGAAGA